MSNTKNDDNVSVDTRLVHGKNITSAWDFKNHVIPPITANTTYRLESVERGAQGFMDFGDLEKQKSAKFITTLKQKIPNKTNLYR